MTLPSNLPATVRAGCGICPSCRRPRLERLPLSPDPTTGAGIVAMRPSARTAAFEPIVSEIRLGV
ncbi:MAG: hypothetical protein PGN25_02415 [Methylorubrum populi]